MSTIPIDIPGSNPDSEQLSEDPEELLPPGSPILRDDTAAALREFLNERERDQSYYDGNPFSENWALSQVWKALQSEVLYVCLSILVLCITEVACVQFWYTQDTAEAIARVVADYVGTLGRVACIACPSLYHELKKSHLEVKCDLLEFDTRFEVRAP